MIGLGARLAAARAERGWSLADAERETGLRTRYLEALERGDVEALPGWAYARAFVRTYARALGLDANELVAEFEAAAPAPEEEIEPIGLSYRAAFPVRRVALLAVAAGAVALVVWAALSSPSTKSPPQAQVAGAATTTSRPVAPVQTTTPAHQTTTTTRSTALVVRAARGRCWLLVRAGGTASGAVLFEGTLDTGETKRFAEQNLWLRLGAPSAVEVTRGGKAVAGIVGSSPVDVVA